MESSKLGSWLQITGAIGIIASLILVALQIRDSNRIASGQMFSVSIDSAIALNTSQLGETPNESMVRVLYEPDSATLEDLYVADRIYDAIFRILVRIHVFDELELYGTEAVDPEGFVSVHYHVFACPYGLAWLESALDQFPPHSRDVPMYKSLTLLQRLAKSSPANARMDKRRERMRVIISELLSEGR